ncbi:MAG: DNA polymerase III subunit [Bacteroidota bacterium]|jgi:DNA polymerase-3 subunit delta'|nr:DNA polymerase III subunit [Bacteroidota bacterium]
MSWDSVIGQQRVKQLLRTMFESGRIPHAMIFHGPEGTGKDAAALMFARALNCEAGGFEPCDRCETCRSMMTLRHPRLKLVFPMPSREDESTAVDKLSDDELEEMNAMIAMKAENPYHRMGMAKAAGIKISSVRDVRKEAAFRSGARGRTVILISEADRMNTSAANALLKTLEEPSGDLLLLLTTSRKDSLLPTIISRCQLLRFDLLRESEILDALLQQPDIDPEDARAAAPLAGGSFGLALQLAREGGLISREDVLTYLRAVVAYNPHKLMERIQTILGKEDRQAFIRFLVAVAGWFRDVLAVQSGAGDRLLSADLREPITKFAEHYPDADCSAAIDEIEYCIDLVGKNVHLANLMIVLSQRLRRCITQDGIASR